MAGLSTEDPMAEEEDDDLDRGSGRLLRARTCLDSWSRLDMACWMPSALWRHEREREHNCLWIYGHTTLNTNKTSINTTHAKFHV